jgi:thymidylate kinase
VEFVGLPGCGKSTVVAALEQRLKARRYRVQGLRNAARATMKTAQPKIGFLARRGERTSLYGALVWAQQHPELFQWMFRLSQTDLVALLWGMEALFILNDEGFLQRFAWNFIESNAPEDIAAISRLLDPDFLTVHILLDPAASYERSKLRRKGVPIGLKSADDAGTVAKFASYQTAIDKFVAARRAVGSRVFEVDGARDLETVLDEIEGCLLPCLPVPPPAPAPRKPKKLAE